MDKENAAAAANEPTPPAPATQADDPPDSVCGTAQEMRTLVASLKSAVHFTRTLHRALPHLQQLLASPVQSDVAEAIALLKYMKHMRIARADGALHKMLALVFARDPTIRSAVLDAFVDLYIDQVWFSLSPCLVAISGAWRLDSLATCCNVVCMTGVN